MRRLTLAGATLRGAVDEKLKGIPGFLGGTELDHVELTGDVDIDNVAGLPGIRAPVPPQLTALAATITVKTRIASSSRISAVTGGDINIAIQPAPSLGVNAWAGATTGTVRVGIDKGVKRDGAAGQFRSQEHFQSPGYDAQPVRVEVRAVSRRGNVNIASVPAAPLASK